MNPMQHFRLGALAPAVGGDGYWFLFQRFNLLVLARPEQRLPFDVQPPLPLLDAPLYVGEWNSQPCWAAEIADGALLPAGAEVASLRRLYGTLDETTFWIAARAVQLVEWARTHRYCGRCGTLTLAGSGEHVRICPQCDLRSYPRISPAVIVRVTREERILLGHNRNHPPGMYTVLAGFVEPGETLEETVAREVKEEVGIDLTNIRYFGSQPWPFPHSLMIGFTADYAGGELTFDDEIEHADWFAADQMPFYPPPPSIANALIVSFVDRFKS